MSCKPACVAASDLLLRAAGVVLQAEGPVHKGGRQPAAGGGCGRQLRVVLPLCRRHGLQVRLRAVGPCGASVHMVRSPRDTES